MKDQVFLSHSSKDKEFARKLANDLKERGITVWLDEWVLKVGDSLNERIGQGIKDSMWLIVIISKNSVTSKWVKKELNAGLEIEIGEDRIFVLPAIIDDCEIPVFLKDKVYADFRNDYSEGLNSLLLRVSPDSLDLKLGEPAERFYSQLKGAFFQAGILNPQEEENETAEALESEFSLYDLIKNNQVAIKPILSKKLQIIMDHWFEFRLGPEYFDAQNPQKRMYLEFGEPILILPKRSIIFFSLEYFSISNYLIGRVTNRFGWNKVGIEIQGNTILHPGYKGPLVLELLNTGEIPFQLYPGMRIGQVSFKRIE